MRYRLIFSSYRNRDPQLITMFYCILFDLDCSKNNDFIPPPPPVANTQCRNVSDDEADAWSEPEIDQVRDVALRRFKRNVIVLKHEPNE